MNEAQAWLSIGPIKGVVPAHTTYTVAKQHGYGFTVKFADDYATIKQHLVTILTLTLGNQGQGSPQKPIRIYFYQGPLGSGDVTPSPSSGPGDVTPSPSPETSPTP